MTIEDIKKCTNIHLIPKTIHLNRGVMFDYRLFDALNEPSPRDIKYDFNVFLPKYGINLQRPYVWKHYQQNEFILSILLEKPIDNFIAIQNIKNSCNREDSTMEIIDGKQRLLTIQKFIHNEFPIIVNGQKVYFNDFDSELKRFFKGRVNYLTADIYYSYEDSENNEAKITDDMKIILFNFYNFAGTPQTEKHKNKLQSLINNKAID
jgi:hypothetical protein